MKDYVERQIYDKVIDSIDMKTFDIIRKRYANYSPDPGSSKYLDISAGMKVAVSLMTKLKLHEMPKQQILDLGSGTGYFLYASRIMGHIILGLDLNTDLVYNSVIKFLKIPRIVHSIQKYQKLPNFGKKFNLITAFNVCFNKYEKTKEFGASEWNFFLHDCLTHLLPKGKISFWMLYNSTKGCYISEASKEVIMNLEVENVTFDDRQITIQT